MIPMKKIDFAFIVHARNRNDLIKRYPLLRFIPNYFFDFLILHKHPFIVSKIDGLSDKFGKPKTGVVIGISMTAHQLIENRKLASKRVIQASRLAKKYGAKYIGLGAMTSSLTFGGKDVIDNVDDIYITTGRTYTIKNISDYVDYCVKLFNLNKNTIKIGVVGAAGGIGFGVSIILAKKGYKKFTLIDLERKLDNLKNDKH